MSEDWNELEELVKKLLSYDRPVRTPLSGGPKGEEDVVGINSVSQCKYTSDKNISILAKDLGRLIDASKLLRKFPIFVSESNAGQLVSFPITDKTMDVVNAALKLACAMHGLSQLGPLIKMATSIEELRHLQKEHRRLKKMSSDLRNDLDGKVTNLAKAIDIKEADLLNYDLFEQGDI